MNPTPVIHLDQWVRREERASLVNFNNSQTQLRRNQGQAPGTPPARCSPERWVRAAGGSGEGAGGCFDWCWPRVQWCLTGGPCCLHVEPGAPEARRRGNNPARASLLNFSLISITQPIDEEFFTNGQPCLWEMTSWSLSDFLARLWSRSIPSA